MQNQNWDTTVNDGHDGICCGRKTRKQFGGSTSVGQKFDRHNKNKEYQTKLCIEQAKFSQKTFPKTHNANRFRWGSPKKEGIKEKPRQTTTSMVSNSLQSETEKNKRFSPPSREIFFYMKRRRRWRPALLQFKLLWWKEEEGLLVWIDCRGGSTVLKWHSLETEAGPKGQSTIAISKSIERPPWLPLHGHCHWMLTVDAATSSSMPHATCHLAAHSV